MKVYKVVISIVNHDGLDQEEIKDVIEGTRYPNWCIAPSVEEIEEMDIGEWSDDHPLNNTKTSSAEFNRLFGSADTKLKQRQDKKCPMPSHHPSCTCNGEGGDR